MRYTASVTFENATGVPETVKTAIVAASHQKAASMAMREAKKALPGRRPSSIVVVLELERENAA